MKTPETEVSAETSIEATDPATKDTPTNIRRIPVFPPITQEFVQYLKDIDASDSLIASAQRSVDRAKAETNPQEKASWWARIRGRH